jgi:predicted lipase
VVHISHSLSYVCAVLPLRLLLRNYKPLELMYAVYACPIIGKAWQGSAELNTVRIV